VDSLVLGVEALVLVDETERPLRVRDYVHCPRVHAHLPRTVTHTPLAFAVTMVGRYGMAMRVTASVWGLIRHSAPARGVVAQTYPAPAATFHTPS
jgi:hypothetical protein